MSAPCLLPGLPMDGHRSAAPGHGTSCKVATATASDRASGRRKATTSRWIVVLNDPLGPGAPGEWCDGALNREPLGCEWRPAHGRHRGPALGRPDRPRPARGIASRCRVVSGLPHARRDPAPGSVSRRETEEWHRPPATPAVTVADALSRSCGASLDGRRAGLPCGSRRPAFGCPRLRTRRSAPARRDGTRTGRPGAVRLSPEVRSVYGLRSASPNIDRQASRCSRLTG